MLSPFSEESYLSWKDRNNIGIKSHIVALLQHKEYNEFIFAKNLITNAGVLSYAQRVGGVAPTNNFYTNTKVQLQSPASANGLDITDTYADFTSPVNDSIKAASATPALNNTDTLNDLTNDERLVTVTYKFEYGTADFSADGITGGCIYASDSTPSASAPITPILNHWNFASPFNKTSTDALILWMNHTVGEDTP